MTFFIFVILFYGGMQVYAMTKAVLAFDLTGPWRLGMYAWALLMTVAPLLIRQLERCDCHVLTVAVAWFIYGWMGFTFLFFWLGLAFDALGLLARVVRAPWMEGPPPFYIVLAAALAVTGYGLFEAAQTRVERVVIRSPKLPPELGRVRIVQLSDMHLGVMIGPRRLGRILEQVRALNPDLLVATGDVVDGQADHLDGLAPLFETLHPRLGKYAVTGNHEHYVGLDVALGFHERAGFTMLRGAAVEVAPGLMLAGVDDAGRPRPGVTSPVRGGLDDEARLLAGLPRERFIVLLKHRPVVDERALGLFDLQLSGHIHGGQIFPFGLLVHLVHPVDMGLNPLPGGADLYVSRGTGTWGPPLRVLAPPEITLIELEAGADGGMTTQTGQSTGAEAQQ